MLMSRYVTQGFELSLRMSGVTLILAGVGKVGDKEALLLLLLSLRTAGPTVSVVFIIFSPLASTVRSHLMCQQQQALPGYRTSGQSR